MFRKKEIVEFLEENDLDKIEEIKKHDECFILKFTYEFDDLEIDGAREYAQDECEEEEDSEPWYEEFFLPYLNDMAMDNINDIIDEIADEYSLDYEMLSYELSVEDYEKMNFLVAFYNKVLPIDIDDLILEL